MVMNEKMLAKRILQKDTAKVYIVNDACVRCGICAKVCPANNITITDEGVQFIDRCEFCYACLHNCPQNSIQMKQERSSVLFRNNRVSLKEIIDVNE